MAPCLEPEDGCGRGIGVNEPDGEGNRGDNAVVAELVAGFIEVETQNIRSRIGNSLSQGSGQDKEQDEQYRSSHIEPP